MQTGTEKNSVLADLRSLRPLLVFLSIYALVFFGLAFRKFYVMNTNTGDSAVVGNLYWQTIHGKPFYCLILQMNHLGVHASYLALLFVPFYWLCPSIWTLFFLQSVVMALSGIPFFLICRRVFKNDLPAWLMTIAYLFYPTVVTNHVDRLGFENLALPFLLWAALFFFEERFWHFLVCALLFMMGQENLPPTLLGFGIYALVKRRSAKWIVSPIILGIVYAVLVFKVAIPYAAGGAGYYNADRLGVLGNTPGEAVMTCLTRPWVILEIIWNLDRAMYLVMLAQALLWIVPFFGWEILLALPSLGLNLVMGDTSFRVIAWHYNPTVGALLCLAAVFGVKRLADLINRRWHLAFAEWGLALAIAASTLASWPLWLIPSQYEAHAYFPTLNKAAALVPPRKSVMSPSSMLARFADRDLAMNLMLFSAQHRWKASLWTEDKMCTFDYVILDANDRRFPPELVTRELVMSFYTNTNYQLILNENNVFVFRRNASVIP